MIVMGMLVTGRRKTRLRYNCAQSRSIAPGERQLAKIRIMYWKEIPVQVQAQDDSGTVSRPLDPRFQEGVDAVAMFDGSMGTDDYMMGWEWGEFREVAGTASDVAESVVERLNGDFPRDFVARIRDLDRNGGRIPTAGAIDDWIEN